MRKKKTEWISSENRECATQSFNRKKKEKKFSVFFKYKMMTMIRERELKDMKVIAIPPSNHDIEFTFGSV